MNVKRGEFENFGTRGTTTRDGNTRCLYNDVDLMTDFSSISELAPLLRRKEISPVEITQQCLSRIEKRNPALNAFITVLSDSALTEAQAAEAEIMGGEWRGPLHGVPIALKDLIDTAGVRTTAA